MQESSMTLCRIHFCRPAIKNDSGGLWRVERAQPNKSRKTGQLFFGQIRTVGLRNSARFLQSD
jgi:hypothetical protein